MAFSTYLGKTVCGYCLQPAKERFHSGGIQSYWYCDCEWQLKAAELAQRLHNNQQLIQSVKGATHRKGKVLLKYVGPLKDTDLCIFKLIPGGSMVSYKMKDVKKI